MKKKIAAFAMAAMLTMTTAMGVSASNDEFTYTEPHPVIFGVIQGLLQTLAPVQYLQALQWVSRRVIMVGLSVKVHQ